MIVPRFIFFTENFVICGNQITKIFRSGTTVLARLLQGGPCYFRLQVEVTIGSFGKCGKTLCLPEPGSTFTRDSVGSS